MKRRLAIAAIFAPGLCPVAAFCAEGKPESGGSWGTFFFFVINFAIFVYLVARYAGPFVSGFFRVRAKTIRGTFDASEKALKEAQDLANRASAAFTRLEAEKTALAKEMEEETARELDRIRRFAHDTAERVRRDGELAVLAAIKAGRRRIRARLARVASELSEKLIRESFIEADQVRLLDEFIHRIGQEARP